MTDPTPTRAEVETARKALAASILALRERAEAAERRAYELAVAIMGGEDAPGYADSIPTQVLVDQQREMAREWLHRVTPHEARRAEAAAWEALEKVSENMAKMATGQTSLIGFTKRIADEAIALRRAAPTEGEA